jgi:two-component system sensor histidine kinase UhpB
MAHILVVDDEKNIRMTLRVFLQDKGYAVDTAEDADQALALLSNGAWDVVVTDIVLPGMSGVELLKAIRAAAPLVQVIMMTGEPTVETAAAAVRAGAFDYMAKPIGKDAFLRAVGNAARIKALADERDLLAIAERCHQENLERLVTERTEQLQTSSAQLNMAIQAAHVGLWDWNFLNGTVYFSPEWKRQLGYDDDEIPNQYDEWESRLHPDDLSRVLTNLKTALAPPWPPYHIEMRLRHKNGSYRWILGQGEVLRYATDKPFRMTGCHLDITERKEVEDEHERLFKEVALSRSRLRALGRRLVEVHEANSRELARELHDRIGQNLTALSINLDIVKSLLPSDIAPKATSRLEESRNLLEQTMDRVRDVMGELRSPVLDDYGLTAALHWYGTQMAQRTGLAVKVVEDPALKRLPGATESALFNICREALNNVTKYAQAKQVTIHLKQMIHECRLTVEDDGIGFDLQAVKADVTQTHWGLLIMSERAEAVNGSLTIRSTPGKGTLVQVEVAT